MIDIQDKRDCCGCGSCALSCPRHCIRMEADTQGFQYPVVDKHDCTECRLCESRCPMLGSQTNGERHEMAFAAYNRDEDLRLRSSSGGLFFLLAESVLSEGGVVFGAKFDTDWSVVHSYTETLEGLPAFMGSKYVQSRLGDSLLHVKRFLDAGRRVLFSGTPCQVAALRGLLRKDYAQLLTVDFVCHGVPSPMVWHRFLDEQRRSIALRYGMAGQEGVRVTGVRFRDKVPSWRSFGITLSFFVEGVGEITQTEPVWENPYMLAFLQDYANRPSCFACQFRCGSAGSDVTLADFWGIENVLSDSEMVGEKGTSLVVTHNRQAAELIERLACVAVEVDFHEAVKGNRAYTSDWPCPLTHDRFFRLLDNGDIRGALGRAQKEGKRLQRYRDKSAKSMVARAKYVFWKQWYKLR